MFEAVGVSARQRRCSSVTARSAAVWRASLEATCSAVSPTTFCTSTTASAASPATAATTNNHSNVVNPASLRRPRSANTQAQADIAEATVPAHVGLRSAVSWIAYKSSCAAHDR